MDIERQIEALNTRTALLGAALEQISEAVGSCMDAMTALKGQCSEGSSPTAERTPPVLTPETKPSVKYGFAMSVTTQKEADAYFEKCVQHQMLLSGCSHKEAESIERSNIACYAAHCNIGDESRARALYGTHPWIP